MVKHHTGNKMQSMVKFDTVNNININYFKVLKFVSFLYMQRMPRKIKLFQSEIELKQNANY